MMVMGAVSSPQTVPFREGLTVSEAIRAAGGFVKDSDSANVKVERKIDGQVRTFKENVSDVEKGMSGEMALRPNDTINVPYQSHSRGPSKALKIGAAILLGLLIFHP